MMKDIRVALWVHRDEKRKFRLTDIVPKAIKFFTHSEYTHSAWYINGYLYESTVWKSKSGKNVHGSRKTKWPDDWPMGSFAPEVWLYPINITDNQVAGIQRYCEQSLKDHMPYNFALLVIFLLVMPFRWFWNKIGWVPFSHQVYGEVCSTYVDEAAKLNDLDLLPWLEDSMAVPVDFLSSPELQRTFDPTGKKK